ncbi:transcription termination factor Rho [Natronosporangium hydrolyticum]|uniref:Transcription termination factor Rho n=1 Tax=Natronosporangium hydrolyticum TaxID=2811111 RepID=A0A895YE30_9ACTN|nr:transcription termination factor Rho [Natronosporangium hydrolyticum]QSB15841.1 transcription termination factor Rho [Natronosporangium hydrolyticum]
MSDTTDVTPEVATRATDAPSRRRGGTGLSAMLLPELQSLAGSLGITGTGRMRKNDLIAAIQERQAGGASGGRAAGRSRAAAAEEPREQVRAEVPAAEGAAGRSETSGDAPARGSRRSSRNESGGARRETAGERNEAGGSRADESASRNENRSESRNESRNESGAGNDGGGDQSREGADAGSRSSRNEGRDNNRRGGNDERRGGNDERRGSNDERRGGDDDDGDGGGRRGRRNRYRDRRRGRSERTGGGGESEPQVADDDVLVPVAGILDVLDNYAFVRTNGYLPGPKDVYVSMAQVRKHGLRRGDAVTGVVRAPRDTENRRDKYNPLVRLDTINGMDPEEARRRPEFYKLTPLYPQQRLRLETEPHLLTNRVIDLVMPIGKGQRALIVSPPKAGKTTVLQSVANSITANNPECHLMVVLVDERPEEVTDMQRSVKGEVIASTFDRPPSDHTTVAELAIERAKRLVELGMDVVVMLDSITRLGRAYNNATPASGRIMSGGIDSTALYPPKRFLGAARNIENGGSLTIFATALVETGSVMDTVIFEEFKATGNAELKLDRKIADKRVFPAIDIDQSGTRKEEILLAPDELAITYKLRKVLHSLESQAALDLLLSKLKENKTNIEFLMQISKTTPGE